MIEDFESTPLKLSISGGNIITSDAYSGSQCYGKNIGQSWSTTGSSRFFLL